MRSYETLVVLSDRLSDEDITKTSGSIEQVLETIGVQALSVESWGRKELAYTLNKHNFGVYIVFTYQSDDSEAIEKLNQSLRIMDSVIKFQTHRLNIPRKKQKPFQSKDDGEEAVATAA